MQRLLISINTLRFGVFNDVLSDSGTMYSCHVMHSLHMVCVPWDVMWDWNGRLGGVPVHQTPMM